MNTEIRIYEHKIEQPKGMYVQATAGRWARAEITKTISEKYEEETGEVLENAFSRINFVTTKNRKHQSIICTGTLVVEVPVASPVPPVVVLDGEPFDLDLYQKYAGVDYFESEEYRDEVADKLRENFARRTAEYLVADITTFEGELTPEEITDPVEGLPAAPVEAELEAGMSQEVLEPMANFFAMSLLASRGMLSEEELEEYKELLAVYREASQE